MMKTDLIKKAGLILMTALMVSTVNAQSSRQGNRGSGPYGPGNERMSAHFSLDLTTEQEEAMKALRTDNYKSMKPIKNKMVELKARERTLMSEESVDMKAVDKVIDNQTDLMNKMRKIQASHKVKVKEILTDEQEMKLEQRGKFMRNKGQGSKRGYHMDGSYHKNGTGSNHRGGGQRSYHKNMG
jgi:Spy/CpxP family protein refolding chaperone